MTGRTFVEAIVLAVWLAAGGAVLLGTLPAFADGFGSGTIKAADKQRDEIKKELAPAAKGGDLKAVKRLVDYLSYKHQFPRADAFEVLCECRDEKVLDFLLGDPLAHPHPDVRSDIIEILVLAGHAKAAPLLEKLIAKDDKNRAQLVAAVAALGGTSSAPTILKVAKGEKDARARAEAIEALAVVAPAECPAIAKAAALDPDPIVRVGAIRALRAVSEDAAFDAAMGNLRDRKVQLEKKKKGAWQPAILSMSVLVETKAREKHTDELKEAIDILIGMLEKERGESGRMRHQAAETIRALTGKLDIDDDHTSWTEWWSVNRERFAPKDVASAPPPGGDGKKGGKRPPKGEKGEGEGEKAPEPEPAPAPAGGTMVRFHGIPIFSDRVGFVIDCSGSMQGEIPVPPAEPSGPQGSGERDKSPKPSGERPKIELSREELARTVRSLPEAIWFNIFTFGDDAKAWQQKGLVPATKPAKAEAESFALKLGIQGRTNYYAALSKPLEDPNVDTVYFLTDGGMTTDGRYIDQDRICRKISAINKFAMVEFNCLLFGSQKDTASGSDRRWLEKICLPSGGKFYVRP